MALSSPQVNNQLIKFRSQVITDFLRSTRFDPYMGDSATMPIVRMSDFSSDGYQLNIPLVNQLSSAGVGAACVPRAGDRCAAEPAG